MVSCFDVCSWACWGRHKAPPIGCRVWLLRGEVVGVEALAALTAEGSQGRESNRLALGAVAQGDNLRNRGCPPGCPLLFRADVPNQARQECPTPIWNTGVNEGSDGWQYYAILA
jgi:hypothetical protein